MKLGIQFHLASLSLSNTVSILEIFGVERASSSVHNWVHKAIYSPMLVETRNKRITIQGLERRL